MSLSRTLTPPEGFASWLDFAVETFDTRGPWLDGLFSGNAESPDRDSMRRAARAELTSLRQQAAAALTDVTDGESSTTVRTAHCFIETVPNTGGFVGWVVGFKHFGVTGATPDEVEEKLRRRVLSMHESGSLALECELARTLRIELAKT